jgi:glucose-1-phosphate thymidylyltransferase
VRAIVLAGGHATRLWPITRHRPKPLLPLGEATILDRLLDQVEPLADEVLVSTNALFEADFAEVLRGREARQVVEDQTRESEKPGALGALFQLADEVPGDEELLVIAGDNHYGFDLAEFVEDATGHAGPTVACKKLASREAARSFGVVETDADGRARAFHEKPEEPPSRLAATALYHYPDGWGELFETYSVAARKADDTRERFDAPGHILEWAVGQGYDVRAWEFQASWFDIGTPDGYLDALREVVGPRFVEGELVDCSEGAGVYAFGDARAHRSTLENAILLPGARVENADLSRCIVDSNARVEDLALEGSLVGAHDRLAGERPSGS